MDDNFAPALPDRAPTILDRSHHSISRRDIDPDALKVLYRLHGHGFLAYLVGGAVRDLLVGRRPADFDIGTDAHPNQIKKLFRNAFLIGRRFRLAHIHFQGGKIIEVSTFRRKPDEAELEAEREEEKEKAEAERAREEDDETQAAAPAPQPRPPIPIPGRPPLKPIAFGTPQEDAFRRDITINALFYDIATYSVIDYVDGLEDLRHGLVRIIGDPDESYTEDPVRIWRVFRHASRLNFSIEEKTMRAIAPHLPLVAAAAGSRLFEELNKDLKSGSARPFFELARGHGFLAVILGRIGELYQCSDETFGRLAEYLSALDAAFRRGASPGAEVVYALLIWPWAKTVLADAEGDKPKILYHAFREAKPAVLVPKGILLDAVQTLCIVEVMLEALATGRMRWSLKKRSHYAGASKICSLLVQGAFAPDEDPFERIFDGRFGTGRPEGKRRRRRPRRKKRPLPPAP
jgi:poly(A) polymerase